jgi:L-seryl-tRNA(Ser) seleniumtransferase
MKASSQSALYRELPSLDELLRHNDLKHALEAAGRANVTEAARSVLTRLREHIAQGILDAAGLEQQIRELPQEIEHEIESGLGAMLRPVINATGVVLHTNLGRAPLSADAIAHIAHTAGTYSNLEMDLEKGERGKRDAHVQTLFRKLLARLAGQQGDAQSPLETIVVNNCAAAVLLALNSLAEAGEVIVSRGELIEIGGSFRLPEMMGKSGTRLREVGTTNRTRISDYERAINEHTKLLMRAHRSNFAVIGFTEQPTMEELVNLGRKHKLPVFEDLGNGALFNLADIGIHGEQGVASSLREGADVIAYSGDKLLGGPQAGMLSGRPDLIARMRGNSLFRALRADKLTYAALQATLLSYLKDDLDAIPALRMMRTPAKEIASRAEMLRDELQASGTIRITVFEGESLIGGGTTPTASLPTFLLSIECLSGTVEALAASLRRQQTPVIARVENDRVLLDLRTVLPDQDAALLAALLAASK